MTSSKDIYIGGARAGAGIISDVAGAGDGDGDGESHSMIDIRFPRAYT
jgi:hypothetical protein